MTTDRKRGYLYILLAAMLYSTTEVALKALGGAFAPMQVTVERVLLGAAALMPFALNDLKKRDIQLTKADWGYFTLLGFLTVTLHMSLFADGGAAHGRLSYIDYLLGQSCVRGGAGALHPA